MPNAITKLEIEPDTPDWTPAELGRLRLTSMFSQAPPKELEKISFKFRYRFTCDHADCAGLRTLCTGW